MSKWILRICILVVFSVIFLNLSGVTIAKDCQDASGSGTSTSAGDAVHEISITPEDDEIEPGGSIIITAENDGFGCPPYTWSIIGTGYSLDKTQTNSDSEEVTLSVVSGTCIKNGTGDFDVVVEVEITDSCGNTGTIYIRNTTGDWAVLTGANENCSGGTDPNFYNYEATQGKYKWEIRIGKGHSSTSLTVKRSCLVCMCPLIPSIISVGDEALNRTHWDAAVDASGYGIRVCCSFGIATSIMTVWNACSASPDLFIYDYRVYEWKCP